MAPKYSPRRRLVYKNGDKINRMEVFERDEWTCWLCGILVDRSLRLPDLMAATLDHRTPLGLGGTHTYANVAIAHALCNFNKGCNSEWTERLA